MAVDEKSARVPGATYGFLYILSNPSMPRVVKVGQTERHPLVRAAELSAHSGVPTPFVVEYAWEVSDRFVAEAAVHAALEGHRTNPGREFYSLSAVQARDIVEAAAGDLLTGQGGYRGRREYVVIHTGARTEYCEKCERPKHFCECVNP
jgi:hypothetical protein